MTLRATGHTLALQLLRTANTHIAVPDWPLPFLFVAGRVHCGARRLPRAVHYDYPGWFPTVVTTHLPSHLIPIPRYGSTTNTPRGCPHYHYQRYIGWTPLLLRFYVYDLPPTQFCGYVHGPRYVTRCYYSPTLRCYSPIVGCCYVGGDSRCYIVITVTLLRCVICYPLLIGVDVVVGRW